MIRRPPRSTLFPYNDALPIWDLAFAVERDLFEHGCAVVVLEQTPQLRSEEHTSELQSQSNLVCRLLLEKKNNQFLFQEALVLQHKADMVVRDVIVPDLLHLCR